jgi:hypothetical protein
MTSGLPGSIRLASEIAERVLAWSTSQYPALPNTPHAMTTLTIQINHCGFCSSEYGSSNVEVAVSKTLNGIGASSSNLGTGDSRMTGGGAMVIRCGLGCGNRSGIR